MDAKQEADCEAKAVEGCHWCELAGVLGVCFPEELSCDSASAANAKWGKRSASITKADFSQLVCEDRKCSVNCDVKAYTFKDCLPVVGGGSARAVSCCDNVDCALAGQDFGLDLDVFRSSDDCSGSSQRMREPVKECDGTSSGDKKFAKFVCGGALSAAANLSAITLRRDFII